MGLDHLKRISPKPMCEESCITVCGHICYEYVGWIDYEFICEL